MLHAIGRLVTARIRLTTDARRRVRVLQEAARVHLRCLRQHRKADLGSSQILTTTVAFQGARNAGGACYVVLSLVEVVQAV